MKFTVLGAKQSKAIEWKLDFKDLAIIEWLQTFWPRMKKRIIDGKEFAWVNYDSLLKAYPLLEIKTKKALYRRMKQMVNLGILEHKGIKDETGSFSFYRTTEKIIELFDDDGGGTFEYHGRTENSHGRIDKSQGVEPKSPIKDSFIKDYNIKQKKDKLENIDFIFPEEIDKKLWEDFLESRKKKATDRAKELLIKDLESFIEKGLDPNEALKNSIKNGWAGLFEPKEKLKIPKIYDKELEMLYYNIKREIQNNIDYNLSFAGAIKRINDKFVIKIGKESAEKFKYIIEKFKLEVELCE